MAGDTFDNRPGVIWYDGTLVPWYDANLHVLTPRAALRELRVRG